MFPLRAATASAYGKTHVKHLENCDPLTGAAATALTFVHGGVEAIVVSRQIEVYTCTTG